MKLSAFKTKKVLGLVGLLGIFSSGVDVVMGNPPRRLGLWRDRNENKV
ncbi:hypothetical protein HYX19_02660 [Candidatus Woesearchaeota archaeon]|nr:hypothetical protein [Candidatus Woesearchaeota archaeon]